MLASSKVKDHSEIDLSRSQRRVYSANDLEKQVYIPSLPGSLPARWDGRSREKEMKTTNSYWLRLLILLANEDTLKRESTDYER